MMRAVAEEFELKQFPEVAGAVRVATCSSPLYHREEMLKAAEFIVTAWRSYTDELKSRLREAAHENEPRLACLSCHGI